MGSKGDDRDQRLGPDGPSDGPVRYTRRLFDKILASFHHACDIGDIEVAANLLSVMEMMTQRPLRAQDGERRRNIESLVAAYERLWYLRNPWHD